MEEARRVASESMENAIKEAGTVYDLLAEAANELEYLEDTSFYDRIVSCMNELEDIQCDLRQIKRLIGGETV